MPAELLTERQIERARPRSKVYRLRDGGSLFLEVRPAGGKLWVMRLRVHGRATMCSLGSTGDVSIAEARARAREIRQQVSQGIDPIRARRAQRAVGVTFGDVYGEWLNLKRDECSESYCKAITDCFNANVLPRLDETPVDAIGATEVLELLRVIERRGALVLANRTRSWISMVLDFAIATGRRERANPAPAIRQALRRFHAKPYPMLPIEQVGEFLRRLQDYTGTRQVAIACEILLRTALRPGELRGLLWGEVNFTSKLIVIPASKMKGRADFRLPLAEQSIALLQELKAISPPRELVVVSPFGKQISDGTLAKAYRVVSGLDVVAHSCRSTFSTWARERQYPRDTVEAALAHRIATTGAEHAYARHDLLEPRRALASDWNRFLDDQRAGRTATVTPLRRRREARTTA